MYEVSKSTLQPEDVPIVENLIDVAPFNATVGPLERSALGACITDDGNEYVVVAQGEHVIIFEKQAMDPSGTFRVHTSLTTADLIDGQGDSMEIDRDRIDRQVVMDCSNTSALGVEPPRIFVSSGGSLEAWTFHQNSERNRGYFNQIAELTSADAAGGVPFTVHDIFGAELNGTDANATYYLGDWSGLNRNAYKPSEEDPNAVELPLGIDGGSQRDHPALGRFDVDGDHLFGVGDDPRVSVHRYQRDPMTLRWVLQETI